MQPLRSHNKSGWMGVSWNTRRRKWDATIRVGARTVHLGLFDDREEAARVRAEALAQQLAQ